MLIGFHQYIMRGATHMTPTSSRSCALIDGVKLLVEVDWLIPADLGALAIAWHLPHSDLDPY